MAIREAKEQIGKLFETGYKTLSKMTFYMDSVEDLANLPDDDGCLAGSKAIDLETGDMYLMSPSGVWNKFGGGSSSGSGNTGSQASGGRVQFIPTDFNRESKNGSLNVSFNQLNEMIEQNILPAFIFKESGTLPVSEEDEGDSSLSATTSNDEEANFEYRYIYYLENFWADLSSTPPNYTAILEDIGYPFSATSPDDPLTCYPSSGDGGEIIN